MQFYEEPLITETVHIATGIPGISNPVSLVAGLLVDRSRTFGLVLILVFMDCLS